MAFDSTTRTVSVRTTISIKGYLSYSFFSKESVAEAQAQARDSEKINRQGDKGDSWYLTSRQKDATSVQIPNTGLTGLMKLLTDNISKASGQYVWSSLTWKKKPSRFQALPCVLFPLFTSDVVFVREKKQGITTLGSGEAGAFVTCHFFHTRSCKSLDGSYKCRIPPALVKASSIISHNILLDEHTTE